MRPAERRQRAGVIRLLRQQRRKIGLPLRRLVEPHIGQAAVEIGFRPRRRQGDGLRVQRDRRQQGGRLLALADVGGQKRQRRRRLVLSGRLRQGLIGRRRGLVPLTLLHCQLRRRNEGQRSHLRGATGVDRQRQGGRRGQQRIKRADSRRRGRRQYDETGRLFVVREPNLGILPRILSPKQQIRLRPRPQGAGVIQTLNHSGELAQLARCPQARRTQLALQASLHGRGRLRSLTGQGERHARRQQDQSLAGARRGHAAVVVGRPILLHP